MSANERHAMPCAPAEERKHNFNEVALGYDEKTAIEEAKRCLNCKHRPCVSGCPVNIAIPDFIQCMAEGRFEDAYQVIAKTSALPAVCGRVCPQETQCESKCGKRRCFCDNLISVLKSDRKSVVWERV